MISSRALIAAAFGVFIAGSLQAQLPGRLLSQKGTYVPPAFQGIGDIAPGAIWYHSPGSCYTMAYAGPTAITKDLATGATSTTLGCSAGAVSVTSGAALSSTCGSTCIVDTLVDQTTVRNCASQACNLTQSLSTGGPYGRFNNPFFGAIGPNSKYGAHFQGYAFGPTQTITSGSYDNTTGLVTLTMSVPHYYVAGGALHTSSLIGAGGVASLNNQTFVTVAPTSGSTITLKGPAGLGATTSITSGKTQTSAQTLNNNVGTFAAIPEPYTVAWVSTIDGLQNAGTSGGPNACNNQSDCAPNVGYQTTTALAIELNNNNGTPGIGTLPTPPTPDTWYSVMGVFAGASSWLCVNGSCTPQNLSGTSIWGGLSYGNGTGGWGGKFGEAMMWSGDKHGLAPAIYANQIQPNRFGPF